MPDYQYEGHYRISYGKSIVTGFLFVTIDFT